uniref:Uncharacterized protein n=1 Tax=Anopheles culicifacies TaxID=139723 RepID=A0A182MH11_9DIPT
MASSSGGESGNESPRSVGTAPTTTPADTGAGGKVDAGPPGSSSSLFGRYQQEQHTGHSSFTVPSAATASKAKPAAAKSSNHNHTTNMQAAPMATMMNETPNNRVPPGGREKTFVTGRAGEANRSSPAGDGTGEGRKSATRAAASSASTKEQPQSRSIPSAAAASTNLGDGS